MSELGYPLDFAVRLEIESAWNRAVSGRITWQDLENLKEFLETVLETKPLIE